MGHLWVQPKMCKGTVHMVRFGCLGTNLWAHEVEMAHEVHMVSLLFFSCFFSSILLFIHDRDSKQKKEKKNDKTIPDRQFHLLTRKRQKIPLDLKTELPYNFTAKEINLYIFSII